MSDNHGFKEWDTICCKCGRKWQQHRTIDNRCTTAKDKWKFKPMFSFVKNVFAPVKGEVLEGLASEQQYIPEEFNKLFEDNVDDLLA